MAATLLLVRHAVHDRVATVLCGRSPGVRLSAEGRRQAGALADRILRADPVAVHASPQPRARETAEPIAARCGRAVQVAPVLDEIDFGAWTGREFAALAGDPRWHAWNTARALACPPGGESMRAAQDRAMRWAVGIAGAHPGGTVVAVSHADVIRAMLAAALDLPLDSYWRFEISPASVSTVLIEGNTARVLAMNETIP